MTEWTTGTNPGFEARIAVGACGQINGQFLHHVSPGVFVVTSTTTSPEGSEKGKTSAATTSDQMATLGPKLWRTLYLATDSSPAEQAAILARVESELPPRCDCRNHWRAYKHGAAPVFGPGFSTWLTDGLNSIRARQGRGPLTPEEARARYA